jgi:putative flippase GtrA
MLKIAMFSRGIQAARGREARRFTMFLLVGGLNTLVGYGFFVALHAAGLPPTPAVIGATILGVLFNFMSTGRIVFASSDASLLPRFLAVYAVQCAINIVSLRILTAAGLNVLVAQAVIVGVLAVLTFLAMKKFVFRSAPPRDPAAS